MVSPKEKGCVSRDISAGPRRNGKESYGNEPEQYIRERVDKRSLSNGPSQHKFIIVVEGERQ
jgi:hypothetical protein